ncbi:MAG: hypothetical protein R3F37_18355 [Candidatus Competibacteraceae bacterium]
MLDAVPHWQRAQEKFTELVGAEQWQELSTRLSETLSALRS